MINKFKFDDYNIVLKSLNVENKMDTCGDKELTIGIKNEYLKHEKINDKLVVPIVFNLYGYEGRIKKVSDLNEEILFKISIVYLVEFFDIDMQHDIIEDEINKLAYFFALPTIKDSISSIGNKIGVPGLTVPMKGGK